MDFGFYNAFIVAGFLAVQFFFSTRNNVYWGSVIPGAYIVFLIWMFVTHRIENTVALILYLLLGLLFLIVEWNAGRKYLSQKRKKELDKIKTHDLK